MIHYFKVNKIYTTLSIEFIIALHRQIQISFQIGQVIIIYL